MNRDPLQVSLQQKMQEIQGISPKVSSYSKLLNEINDLRKRLGLPKIWSGEMQRPSKSNQRKNRDIRKGQYRFEHPIFS